VRFQNEIIYKTTVTHLPTYNWP